MTAAKETLYLIDGSFFIYRAFYAVRHLSTSTGTPTNAVYGFVGMLNRVLREKQPQYLAIALDAPGPTFRHQLSPDYKANRPQMPEALSEQIPYIKRVISAYGIPCVEVHGYEADDIIGTLAVWASGQGRDVVIISGDKDLLQLLNPQVQVWDTIKDEFIGPAQVQERFGVPAPLLVEIMGLAGDSSDNIPGVPGIGIKTAQRLIKEFGNLEHLLSNLPKVSSRKERTKLETYAEQAILSRKLFKINCEVPMDRDWDHLRPGTRDRDELISLFQHLEFKRLLQELGQEPSNIEVTAGERDHNLITTQEELDGLLAEIHKFQQVAIILQTSGDKPLDSELVGLTLAYQKEAANYIPLRHIPQLDRPQLDPTKVLQALAPVLSDPAIAKVAHHSKSAWIIFKGLGIELRGVKFDTMLGAYVLDPSKEVRRLEALTREHLGESLLSIEDLLGKEGKRLDFTNLPLEQASMYAGEQAATCLRLAAILGEKIKAADQAPLFYDLELPLVPVLARMEMNGVGVDVTQLANLSKDFNKRLDMSADIIYDLAGEHFNINSPQQLGSILFDKLGLPMGKKTKTGYSTAMNVLAALADLHPLPAEVLTYRSLTKLKSTYVEALQRMVNPTTGRIHTCYNQTVTVTGRLSSSDPNLQNIPVRTEEGRRIRRAFVAAPGCKLVSADYSQIELRVLAHFAEDEALTRAFRQDEDIHLRTAADVFGVEPSAVSEEMRRKAKAINFGIIYGMGPFRLAQDLCIPRETARQIIERYFERYQGVRSYVEKIPEIGRKQGFVSTLLGRKRFLPDLHSRNRNVRQFAERTAINTPIQGTAADIMKIAMIRIDAVLQQGVMPARMILQVHDELVFEVESDVAADLASFVQQEMESAVSLHVPLMVQVGFGENWDEVH